ncbi:HEPN domain-containing protein [Saccharicrinis sp. FJH62]|uniref:HEPN domain-containing protein n=1 Tax=Saccharicrinis sp. FJH62 TaxID=3344657 RepID=UPI0035D472A3
MSLQRLNLIEKNLDNLFDEISKLDEGDVNKAHLSRYLCIRTSGYLETVIRSLILNFCEGTSPQQIENYLTQKTKYITNLEYKKILRLLGEFSKDWKETFESNITDIQKSSLNSVVSNRNSIAHGNTDSITFRNMKEYYLHIKDVVLLLKNTIKK